MLEIFRGDRPLSRIALACRFAAVATVYALLLLPLVPVEYFYHRAAIFNYDGSLLPGIHWRARCSTDRRCIAPLYRPMCGQPSRPGLFFRMARTTLRLLTFFYAAVFVSLLGHWLSDETLPFLRLAVTGLVFIPYLWAIPVIGAVAGTVLARRVSPEPTESRARFRHAVQPLVLSIAPLFAIVGIAQGFPPPETGNFRGYAATVR